MTSLGSIIRILVAIAVIFSKSQRQFDITWAYLNGNIEEELFMEVLKYFTEELVIRQRTVSFNENQIIKK